MNTSIDVTTLGTTAAFPPPPGVTPNFINPSSIAWQVAPIRIAFTSAATFFVVLRIYTRGFLIRSLGIDDAFVVISLIISWAFTAFGIAAIPYGYGVDLWNLYVSDVIIFLKIDLGGQLTYFLGTLFVKLSILLMYLRLNPERTFRRITFAIIVFDVTYLLLSCCVSAFGCMPVETSWDFTEPHKCVNKKTYFYAQANFNIVSDFATLLLPVRMCLRLQLPTRQRWMLGLLFAVGSFACIVSIVRLATLIPSLHSMNFTRFKVQVGTWAAVELNISIICACLTCLKPLAKCLFPGLMATNSNSNTHSDPPTSTTLSGTPSKKTSSFSNSIKRNCTDVMPAFPLRSLSLKRAHSEEQDIDREAEIIKARIRGWSTSKTGYTNKVTTKEANVLVREHSLPRGEDAEGESVRRILSSRSDHSHEENGNGEAKGLEGQKGGVLKTVVYDVKFGD